MHKLDKIRRMNSLRLLFGRDLIEASESVQANLYRDAKAHLEEAIEALNYLQKLKEEIDENQPGLPMAIFDTWGDREAEVVHG